MRKILALALAGAIPVVAVAQVAPPVLTPGLIERVAPLAPPRLAPSLQRPAPEAIRGPNEMARIRIDTVRLNGNTVLSDAALLPLVQPLVGQEVTLAAIEATRVEIISAFGRAGYPFVTVAAGVSPTAQGAELVMVVTEGQVTSVKLDGDIGPAGVQVLRFLNRLVGAGPLTDRALERAVLLAGDVPGVTIRTVLRNVQGGAPGELELVGQVTRRAFSGYLSVDNRGYRLTGPVQGLLVAGSNSFTSLGERIEFSLFQAQDWEQTFGQASGEVFVGGSGLRVRLYAGAGIARPGSPLAAVGYRGHTRVFGIGATYPIIRSRALNLLASGQFDALDSEIALGNPNRSRSNFDEVRALRLGLDGSLLDTVLAFAPSPATNTANLRLHHGLLWFGGGGGGPNGPARAGSDFTFTKLTGELSRTQPFFAPAESVVFSLQGVVGGQWTNDILPSAEKFYLGGNRLGRGFYVGQLTGDKALAAAVELQMDVRPGAFSLPSLLNRGPVELQPTAQFYLFRDYGRTWENLRTDPDRRMESWGGGVRMVLTENLQLDIEGVHRLTRRVDAGGATARPLPESAAFFRLLTRF